MTVDLVSIEPGDIPLIEIWLAREHVVSRWGKQSYESFVGQGEERALITADGQKVGYIQWQCPTRQELDIAGLIDIPTDIIDIDIFIGEASMIGQGIGSSAVQLLTQRLMRDMTCKSGFMACSAVDNEASIRMFQKAGFNRDRVFDDAPDGGPHVLMIKR